MTKGASSGPDMLQAHKAAVDRFVAEARGSACSARAAWLIEGRERDSIQGFLVSVKSGKPSVLHVKELIATLEDQGGALGLLIELDAPTEAARGECRAVRHDLRRTRQPSSSASAMMIPSGPRT